MASKSAQDILINNSRQEIDKNISSVTFTKEGTEKSENSEMLTESSSYTLASDQSQFSSAVDTWLKDDKHLANTGVQDSRVPVVQRSTLVTLSSFGISGMWYILATAVPIFGITANYSMRCLPGTFIKTAEFFFTQVARVFEEVRRYLRRLSRDRPVRDFIAASMDVVLIVYALGFLILSMYQAAVFI